MNFVKTVGLCALSCLALGAQAQTMKPGLWEMSSKVQMPGMTPEQQQRMEMAQAEMAKMPPEIRKMMESAMAKQGVSMVQGSDGGIAVRVCITKDMAERNNVPVQQRGNCTSSMSPRTGNTMKMSFSCTDPVSSGEGTYTFESPEAYSMKMTINADHNGKPGQMHMNSNGRWISSGCGEVKPIAMPKQ